MSGDQRVVLRSNDVAISQMVASGPVASYDYGAL